MKFDNKDIFVQICDQWPMSSISSIQLLTCVVLFVTPWTAAC